MAKQEQEQEIPLIPKTILEPGNRGPDVVSLCNYLARFGYLPNKELQTAYGYEPAVRLAPTDPSVYDAQVEEAVRLLQRFYGLPEDARLNKMTLDLIQRPRCGVPDVVRGAVKPRYVLSGYKWPMTRLTWSLFGPGQQLPHGWPVERLEHIIREQAAEWGSFCRLRFSKYQGDVPQNANIHAGWFPGAAHASVSGQQCPDPFGPNILAHGYYPAGGGFSGQIHFNTAVNWSDDYPCSGTDVYSVMIHELGHTLGLAHSGSPDACMFAYYKLMRTVSADDINGIMALYGS